MIINETSKPSHQGTKLNNCATDSSHSIVPEISIISEMYCYQDWPKQRECSGN